MYFQENDENKDLLDNLLNNVLEIIKPFITQQSKFPILFLPKYTIYNEFL